ncbi:hypothetical protein IWX90DRAFT_437393 [Phyllosticta citrichinensis]|uniref:Secreted protein n=1 Tax=Phyllosticta citrichinensis TaxID=1130410 RepID=A0ABR1XMA1_9PEZI
MPLERPSFALTLIIFFLRAALSKGCLFTARWLALPQIRLPTPQTHKTCPSSPTSPLPQSLHNPYVPSPSIPRHHQSHHNRSTP